MPKGAKNCPKCKVVVGCRTHTCPCGYRFETAINPVEQQETEYYPVSGYTIMTPAGSCPVRYSGDLDGWIEHLQAHFRPNQLGATAILYWLRQQVPVHEYHTLATSLGDANL